MQPRKHAARPLADLLEGCMTPALRRQGFVSSDLLVNWDEIVGPRLAAHSEPIELRWPRRPPQADPEQPQGTATLIVRVEGAFALEFDYAAALLAERVNSHFGWRCVGRIIIKQGPVAARAAPKPTPRPIDAATRKAIAGLVEGAEPGLASALTRLGEGVFAAARSKE